MELNKPIIIVGAPRSGTTLLFAILSSHPEIWSLYDEGETYFGRHYHPAQFGWKNGCALDAEHYSEKSALKFKKYVYLRANNYQLFAKDRYSKILTNRWKDRAFKYLNRLLISPIFRPDTIRLVYKNPLFCHRLGLISKFLPEAKYIFITREPKANLASLIDGWNRIRRFGGYTPPGKINILGYSGRQWKFNLPPGWEDYAVGKSLAEVCAYQYFTANTDAINGLHDISNSSVLTIKYEDLIKTPSAVIKHICSFVNVEYKGGLKKFAEIMPPVNTTTAPREDKWLKFKDPILAVIPKVAEVAEKLGYSVDLTADQSSLSIRSGPQKLDSGLDVISA